MTSIWSTHRWISHDGDADTNFLDYARRTEDPRWVPVRANWDEGNSIYRHPVFDAKEAPELVRRVIRASEEAQIKNLKLHAPYAPFGAYVNELTAWLDSMPTSSSGLFYLMGRDDGNGERESLRRRPAIGQAIGMRLSHSSRTAARRLMWLLERASATAFLSYPANVARHDLAMVRVGELEAFCASVALLAESMDGRAQTVTDPSDDQAWGLPQ